MSERIPGSPFSDLVVVELADTPAGEHTGKLMADAGATVIKVEPAEGATSRRTGPWLEGRPGADRSLSFWVYNTSKQSVVIDGPDPADGPLAALLDRADVVITTDGPARLAERGLTPEALVAGRPRLIVLSVSPFGLTGPWADYRTTDLVGLAAGGPLNSCGYDDHSIPPILPGGNQAFQNAASYATMSLLLALLQRQVDGLGQVVDVSMHEANAVSGELANPYYFYPKAVVQRQTARHAQPVPTQPALFPCADGYVYFALILGDLHLWKSLVAWMDAADLAADLVDPAYEDFAHRQAQFSHVQEVLEVFFLLHDADTLYLEGQARGLPVGPLRAFEDLPQDEHLRAREFFLEVPVATDEGERAALFPGAPFRFSAFEPQPSRPPRLGEHDVAVAGGGGDA
ncbi:CaiB/BaiF CoA transferase family protein [Nocardioides zeae]|uniref:CaiB/BaiF CoA transferase family protein n=1 Tax=Nocardioides zeae TaxID=1457234 RepID=UPI001575FA62|nr:CoA transferase [Nocardioides zeae]